MLKQRVWAATVLILAFLAALFYSPPILWAFLIGAIALGGAWEWARLCGLSGFARALYVLLLGAVILALYVFPHAPLVPGLWLVALLFWFIVAPLWMIQH